MARNLILVKKPNFEGFGCSECNWVYEPASTALAGESLEQMMKKGAKTANLRIK